MRSERTESAVVSALLACVLVAARADTLRAQVITTAISQSSGGVIGDGTSGIPTITADGRFVFFRSSASNLSSADLNGAGDAFVYDRVAGTMSIATLSSTGMQAQGNPGVTPDAISPDGRFAVFTSDAQFVPEDTNPSSDIYVRDMWGQTTTLASKSTLGVLANKSSLESSISADGRYIAFRTSATNLVHANSQLTNINQVFVRDRQLGITRLVSRSGPGQAGDSDSSRPKLSQDGRFVAFVSDATNLIPNDTNSAADVFMQDIATGIVRRVNVPTGGGEANGGTGS